MKSFLLIILLAGTAVFCQTDSRPLYRIVTPNGDRRNDSFIYKCYNPQDLKVTGEIFDLNGKKVSDMKVIDSNRSDYCYILQWVPSGKVRGGVYIYQITLGERRSRGTFIVVI